MAATEIDRLRKINAELAASLRGLIKASQHMSPFGGEASVKGVRLAGKYMEALDRAEAALKDAAK